MVRAGIFIGVDKSGDLQRLNDAAQGARRMHEWAVAQGIHAKLITDVGGTVGTKLKSLATVDLTPLVQKAREALNATYSLGSAQLTIKLEPSLGPGSTPIYARPEAIVVNVCFEGSGRLNIKHL